MNAAVVVVSTKIVQGQEADRVRLHLESLLREQGMNLVSYEVIPDERTVIRDRLRALSDSGCASLILTVGGTGVRPTDWTPEATRDICEKEIPGIGEAMRAASMQKVRTAMLSRATAGVRGQTLIVNLPGSVKGLKDNLNVVFPILEHTVKKIAGQSSAARGEPARARVVTSD
ncbi:MAG: MogA/MoaB family molybdenum cofactor biosynthesis protein [Nitrospirae bacterium]|nr:MAG: MogA/MoaB family molybdenum cofactor biosynthesis protein [Nitrospirota bacterium]